MITVKNRISNTDLYAAIDANNIELLDKWRCHANSFIPIVGKTNKELIDCINSNMRYTTLEAGMTGEQVIKSINASYNRDVSRFQDLIIEHVIPGDGIAEPTALVTDDGNQMDLWCTSIYTYTTDGINFAAPVPLVFHHTETWTNIMCLQMFRDGNNYYCTSVVHENAGIVLWTSTDKINWYFEKIIFTFSDSSLPITSFGNEFNWKENGKWYMLYEASINGGYQICLAESDSLTGTWIDYVGNPVISSYINDGLGNPELARVNNTIYKCDGKYFVNYHYHLVRPDRAINRAWSYDLKNWTVEGPMLDTRVPPDNELWSNGDQCMCEFKGKTYLFYSNHANQYITGDSGASTCIDMCVDFRPLSQLLRLYP